MITLMYAIYDKKAKMYNKPFFQINDAIATRSATDLVSTPGTDIFNNPQDFCMFKLGSYDDELGQLYIDKEMPLLLNFTDLDKRPEIS